MRVEGQSLLFFSHAPEKWGIPESYAYVNLQGSAICPVFRHIAVTAGDDVPSGIILSVQSNQFVQSKMQTVQSKIGNCAVTFL